MDQVEGTVSLVLNGQPIAPVAATTSRYEIELPDLAERNVLVLEIEIARGDRRVRPNHRTDRGK